MIPARTTIQTSILAALLAALQPACGTVTSMTDDADGGSQGADATTDADAATGADAMPGQASVHLPIFVTLNAHGHNYGFPAQAASTPNWIDLKQRRYNDNKDEILWLADIAESYGARFSFQLNGEYSRDARVLYNDTGHIRDLMAAGHSVGTHFHPYSLSGANEFWGKYSNAQVTPAIQEKIYRDHLDAVIAARGSGLRRMDPAGPLATDDERAKHLALVAEYNVDIIGGGEPFNYTEWNQNPYNPYRPAFPKPLLEDPNGAWIAALSLPQVGLPAPQGKHQVLTTVPQLKRRFLLLYAEWRYSQLMGDDERIWTFGIMTHPDQNANYRGDVEEIIRWLSEDMGTRTGPSAQAVLQFATDEKTADAFKAWEQRNPTASSFNFDWDAYLAGEAQPYPYHLRGLAEGLLDSELVSSMDELRASGIEGFELVHRHIDRGPMDAEGIRQMTIGDTELPLFLLWSENRTTVDLSAQLTETVYIKNGVTGVVSTAPAAAIPVGVVPIAVCERDDYF